MRRRSLRSGLPAALAAVLLVVGQLLALAHEAEERHVECAEHGETLDAATLAEAVHACDDDHLIAVDSDGGEHEDCAISRVLRQSSAAPRTWAPPPVTLTETPTARFAVVDSDVTASTLYLIAPKTSPPRSS